MVLQNIPVPHNEKERVKALHRYAILDTLSESEFDDITRLISHICQVPIAHISFMDKERQWVKSKMGFEAIDIPRNTTFCQYTIMESDILEIPDTFENETFKDNPNVTEGMKIRFYAGAPLTTPDGFNIGTVCVIDQAPKKLSEDQTLALSTLAKHIVTQLELRYKINEVEKAKKIAELAVYAKDSFLTNMSHEIRTPMNAIIGFTDLLAQSQLNPLQLEYVNNVQTAGENLLLIINDILDLSKIESGNLTIESYPFELKKTLKHVYDLLKPQASENNIDFHLFLDADLPDTVMGDKGRINQIIMNLAGNAIKFTEQGEVSIYVKKTAETDTQYTLKFSVKDTGIGIAKDKIDTIFDRFTQAEDSTTRKYGGTGLGLNIVKQLIGLQGGKIKVKSQLNVGSEFYFSLNFDKASTATPTIATNLPSAIDIQDKISILLCEDNILNQRLAKSVIQNFGFELDIAGNGQEGLEMMAKKEYDLILMDLQMPIMDGYQTTIYVREELQSNIPIVALTAHSLIGEQQKCFDIGMDAYVAKPFKQDELLNKIKEAILKKGKKTFAATSETTPYRTINFSYITELLGENAEIKNEIITIFLNKLPAEILALEGALETKDYNAIKMLAHTMKSSLAMFKLDEEVAFLNALELGIVEPPLAKETVEAFQVFKHDMQLVILSLLHTVGNYTLE